MKVLIINSVCGIRSTGRICTELADSFMKQGNVVKIAYGREGVPDKYKENAIRIGNGLDVRFHAAIMTRILDKHGFGSKNSTRRFLKWAEEFNPDLLWLHNLHGYYINIELLFQWIKSRPNMQVKWTLHDCWAFTGHCTHFVLANCNKWRRQCEKCSQKKKYPASIFIDNSKQNFYKKKQIFNGVKNLQIIVPSNWLKGLVEQSFLKSYQIEVKYNKVDTNIFKPLNSNFREKYSLEEKIIILGVASAWGREKGLFDFYELSTLLDERYKIVLVGVSNEQKRSMPPSILAIQRTDEVYELAKIYSAANIFFNPTYEDTFPTVNLEAEACGTKVITYNTGGAAETIHRGDSNIIPVGDLKRVVELIQGENSLSKGY